MNPRYPEVAYRAIHRCEYCHAPESIFNFPFEVEHIIPPNHGGSHRLSNLALACRSCNLLKSNHVMARDPDSGESVRLFNPRKQQWTDHFTEDRKSGTINGITPVGRATVALLQINGSTQRGARLLWIKLGIHR